MRILRILALVASSAALIATMMAPAASAAPALERAFFVQGSPGVKVDICIDGKEYRSALRYGHAWAKNLAHGTHVVKFFKKDARACAGTKLAQRTITLSRYHDLTVVLTRKTPGRVLVFDNHGGYGAFNEEHYFDGIASIVWRHAADLGTVRMRYGYLGGIGPWPARVRAALPPGIWRKGDEFRRRTTSIPVYLATVVTRPSTHAPLVRPATAWLQEDRRYEFILVGTTAANARLLAIPRKVAFIP